MLLILAAAGAWSAKDQGKSELARWEQEARNTTIVRDDWGIAHIFGKTDADAVFGAVYAQAEDDFNRIETNYINAMGRLAEAEGDLLKVLRGIWIKRSILFRPVCAVFQRFHQRSLRAAGGRESKAKCCWYGAAISAPFPYRDSAQAAPMVSAIAAFTV